MTYPYYSQWIASIMDPRDISQHNRQKDSIPCTLIGRNQVSLISYCDLSTKINDEELRRKFNQTNDEDKNQKIKVKTQEGQKGRNEKKCVI